MSGIDSLYSPSALKELNDENDQRWLSSRGRRKPHILPITDFSLQFIENSLDVFISWSPVLPSRPTLSIVKLELFRFTDDNQPIIIRPTPVSSLQYTLKLTSHTLWNKEIKFQLSATALNGSTVSVEDTVSTLISRNPFNIFPEPRDSYTFFTHVFDPDAISRQYLASTPFGYSRTRMYAVAGSQNYIMGSSPVSNNQSLYSVSLWLANSSPLANPSHGDKSVGEIEITFLANTEQDPTKPPSLVSLGPSISLDILTGHWHKYQFDMPANLPPLSHNWFFRIRFRQPPFTPQPLSHLPHLAIDGLEIFPQT